MQRVTTSVEDGSWDQRIDPGVDVRAVPPEARSLLAQALGTLGVEAEYALALLRPFTNNRATVGAPATRADGERFLWQIDAWARRMTTTGESLEVATQAFLAHLESVHPELHGAASEGEHPWWPDLAASRQAEGSLEMSLRRCGFAYRHVVAARLAEHTQAIGEQMALVLHALSTVPPAGVLPLSSLHAGLYELAEVVQGDVVLRHLRDVSAEHPGVVTGIARLLRLDATDDRSVEADITWARGQLAELERLGAQLSPTPALAAPPPRRGLGALFRRGPVAPRQQSPSTSAAAFLAQSRQEWSDTITALEALLQPARGASASSRR